MPSHHEYSRPLPYRPDIDGLRAIAVLSVVVFHAFPEAIPGGFIGVDVFFVISGFLISSIIFTHLEENRFSIADFYSRRIHRILPALVTVMVASLIFGWLELMADEYQQLGKHVAAGASFISNFIFWSESGYFDTAAELKPMLHLWSLSIEEQFYILWPLLLAISWRLKGNLLRITGYIAAISFLANLHMSNLFENLAFYSPLGRFWELMIGGILAHVTLHHPAVTHRFKNTRSALGLIFLVAGLILINKSRMFPGWWVLLPTVGAFLLISAGPTAWINEKVLSTRLLVWFGLISYPLYLWHWPLLAFARITEGDISTATRAALVAASILLAWLTYRFIEKPLRGRSGMVSTCSLLLTLFMTGLFGYFCMINNGYEAISFREKEKNEYVRYFENELPEWHYFEREKMPENYNEKCNFYNTAQYRARKATQVPLEKIDPECYTTSAGFDNKLFIWGDSHASQLYSGIQKNMPKNWKILQVTSSGCHPSIQSPHDSETNFCEKSNWFALKTIKKEKPDVVIVAQSFGHDAKRMAVIGSSLEKLGVKTVIFTGATPHWTSALPKIILRKLWTDTPKRTLVGVDTQILADDKKLQHEFPGSSSQKLVSIIDYFCNKDGCVTYIGSDRKSGITTWDYGHLTPIASNALSRDVLVPLIVNSAKPRLHEPNH